MENQIEIENENVNQRQRQRDREKDRDREESSMLQFGKAFVGNYKFSATITKAREHFSISNSNSMEKPIGIALRC